MDVAQLGIDFLAYSPVPPYLSIYLLSYPSTLSLTTSLTALDRMPCVHTCTSFKGKREWSSSQRPKYEDLAKALLKDLPPPTMFNSVHVWSYL